MQPSTGAFLYPEQIVKSFDLEPGDHVADFGAGHGYFTIPMAKTVGGDGKVYALDIQKPTLEAIKARAKPEHLFNIETIWTDLDLPRGSKLRDRFIDFVLISNILFQSENRKNILEEAQRILREGGRMALVEWDPSQTRLGPPAQDRVSKETTRELAEQAGFTLIKEFEAGAYHYGLLFKKS